MKVLEEEVPIHWESKSVKHRGWGGLWVSVHLWELIACFFLDGFAMFLTFDQPLIRKILQYGAKAQVTGHCFTNTESILNIH